jgi:hypothetical protein
MEFADGVVRAAWDRQGGRCAKCGRWLVWARRGRGSATGAWQPHHKNPEDQEERDTLANCIIFCSGIADCHFEEGHAGINWSHYASLDDSMLLFLHAGEEEAERTPKAPSRKKGGLVRTFLGMSQVPAGEKRGAHKHKQKRKPKLSPREPAGANGKKEAVTGLLRG